MVVKYKDARKASDRREYFREYHERRRLAGKITSQRRGKVIGKSVPRAGPSFGDLRSATTKRNKYLEEVGGWPERRALHPESIEETLAKRCR